MSFDSSQRFSGMAREFVEAGLGILCLAIDGNVCAKPALTKF